MIFDPHELTLFAWLSEEIPKLPDFNPFAGSKQEPGDLPVGKLTESELAIFRLVCSIHDKITQLSGGRTVLTPEQEHEISRLAYMHKALQRFAMLTIVCRLGWKHLDLGFLEDGTIVSFIPKDDTGSQQEIVPIVVQVIESPDKRTRH